MMHEVQIDPQGWIAGARRLPSPNCDPRPAASEPELLVVHAISLPPGHFGGGCIADLFLNRLDTTRHPFFARLVGLRVSAHLLVRRQGEVVQFVALSERAWHAGLSCFEGRADCNDFSIGIELEGDDHTSFEAVQYRVLAGLIRAIAGRYPRITAGRIVGHSDIAPGRKTDPGPCFDWEQLHALLGPGLTQAPGSQR